MKTKTNGYNKGFLVAGCILLSVGLILVAAFAAIKVKNRIQNPKISVIIPVYNEEDYLEECLDSVINQSYKNLEIICVNDGSKDRSLSILKSYEKKDSRITVIDKENGGISSARNAGLKCSHGDYITFVDSDDWIDQGYYETCIQKSKEKPADIIVCGIKDYDLGVREDYTYVNDPFTASDEICASAVYTKFYKRDVIFKEKVEFKTDVNYGEDALFNLMCFSRAKNIRVIPYKFYNYRIVQSSVERTTNEESRLKFALNRAKHMLADKRIREVPGADSWLFDNIMKICKSRIDKLDSKEDASFYAKKLMDILDEGLFCTFSKNELSEIQKSKLEELKNTI